MSQRPLSRQQRNGNQGQRKCCPNAFWEVTMRNDPCGPHHKGDGSWWANDARGIPLKRVCERCERAKLAGYRPDVLTDANYWHDEPIEAD